MKKKSLIILAAITILGGSYYVYSQYSAAQKAKASLESIETARLEMGDLVTTISATGQVRSSQSATLAWKTSGTVETAGVKIGDQVKTGQILARLQQTSLPQSVITAQADLASARKALEDLNGEAETARVKALEDILNYESSVRDAQYQFDNYVMPSVLANLTISEALEKTKSALDKARAAFEPYKFLPSNDARREEMKKKLDQAQSDYNAAIKRLEYEYTLEGRKAVLNKAWSDFEKWKNGPDPIDVEAQKARIAAAEAALKQALIEAPFNGIISDAYPQPGDQVAQGDIAFRIDNLSTLYVDVNVSEVDIHQIAAGQQVTITVDALRGRSYRGEVTQVAMISETSDSGTVNFKVVIKFIDNDQNVRPGMTTEVNIIVDKRLNVLLVPLQAIQSRNGKQSIYLFRNGESPKPVNISLGVTSDAYGELLEGNLKPGDTIVLNPTALNGGSGAAARGGMFRMGGGRPPRDNTSGGR